MSESELPILEQAFNLNLLSPTDKYYSERAMAVFLILLSLGLAEAVYVIFNSVVRSAPADSFGSVLILVVMLIAIIAPLPVLGIRMWLIAQREEKLVVGDKEPAFVIDATGVSGSIVMLEGPQRGRLRKSGQARFSLKWDDIIEVRFVPGRRGPALMKIVPNDGWQDGTNYFVNREKLWSHEQHIAELLKAHGVAVSVQGELH